MAQSTSGATTYRGDVQRHTVTLLNCPGAKRSISCLRLVFTGAEDAPGCFRHGVFDKYMQQGLNCCKLHVCSYGGAFDLLLRYFRVRLESIFEKGAEKVAGMMPCHPSPWKEGTC